MTFWYFNSMHRGLVGINRSFILQNNDAMCVICDVWYRHDTYHTYHTYQILRRYFTGNFDDSNWPNYLLYSSRGIHHRYHTYKRAAEVYMTQLAKICIDHSTRRTQSWLGLHTWSSLQRCVSITLLVELRADSWRIFTNDKLSKWR